MTYPYLFTAEAVTPSHPDKICDRISDALVDVLLRENPYARCAIETAGGHGEVYITGEIAGAKFVSEEQIHDIVKRITKNPEIKLVGVNIVEQSQEIAQGVDVGGAGDQGIMVGYYTDRTQNGLPLEMAMAKFLASFLYDKYETDGKTQVTIYENGTIQSLVASFQSVPGEVLKKNILEWIDINQLKLSGEIYCNPAGDWNIGGLDADAGLTGRKIICDAYGPNVYVGGGAFSGKDATKVDRSGAIYARHLAKKEIENRTKYDNEFYSECVVKIAYSIGMEKPLMVTAETTTHYINGDYEVNKKIINDTLTVQETIEMLDLRKPNFEKMAEWGPFFQPLPKRKKIMYN